jgi:acylphosphatase
LEIMIRSLSTIGLTGLMLRVTVTILCVVGLAITTSAFQLNHPCGEGCLTRISLPYGHHWMVTVSPDLSTTRTVHWSNCRLSQRCLPITATTLQFSQFSLASNDSEDHNESISSEIVARRIIVKGDVQGGYYRSCVLNEAGKFRRLVGTMSPPDDTDEAEIYVEGKRHLVDGFVRWCRRSKVGMNQLVAVKDVLEEEPTGMYEGFYAQTRAN